MSTIGTSWEKNHHDFERSEDERTHTCVVCGFGSRHPWHASSAPLRQVARATADTTPGKEVE